MFLFAGLPYPASGCGSPALSNQAKSERGAAPLTIRGKRISKLYAQIIACFLCLVVFSGAVLTLSSVVFARRSEQEYLTKIQDRLTSADERLRDNVMSILDLCSMISGNALITENFKPYPLLTSANLYYYPSIIDLLRQSRLQLDSIIDSIFLYADDQHVLFSMNEKGMTAADTFFGAFMRYETYDKAYWNALLASQGGSRFTFLNADSYRTQRVNDVRTVIPLVYQSGNAGFTTILVMNLSVEKILALYSGSQVFSDTVFLAYDDAGTPLVSADTAPACAALNDAPRTRYLNQDCYVTSTRQKTLDLTLYALTPVSVFRDASSYFRFTVIGLTVVYVVCGLILALFMSRRTYAPIREVKENILSASDETQSETKYISDELAAIRDGIRTLAAERETFKSRSHQRSWHYVTQGLATLLDERPINDEQYFNALLETDYGFCKRGFRCADIILDAEPRGDYIAQDEYFERLTDCLLTFLGGVAFIQVRYQGNMLVLLLDSDGTDEAALRERFKAAADRFAQGGDAALRVGLGGMVRRLSDISESFEQANSEVFFAGAPKEHAAAPFAYNRGDIVTAANTRDLKQIEDAAEEILAHAQACRLPYREAALITRDIYKTVMETQRRLGLDGVAAKLALNEDEFSVMEVLILSPAINLTPLLAALLRHIPYQSRAEKSAEDIAHRLKAYIDTHFGEELSLDILSDKFSISSKYLSRVFKQTLGVNLSDYLAYVRMEKVKELLKTELPLEKIAETVGIFNRTTFTRTFRKLEGMTPGEYRSALRVRAQDDDPSAG